MSSVRSLLLAALTALTVWSCKDPVAVRYGNPADPSSASYVPAPPSSLTAAVVSDTLVTLQWTDSSNGENGFRVSLRSGSDTAYIVLAELAAGSTAFADTLSKHSGVPYRYRVASFSAAGECGTPAETTVTFLLQKPFIQQARGSDSSALILEWAPNTPFPTENIIERRSGTGEYTVIARTAPFMTAYTDTAVNKRTVYEYRVTSATPRQSSPASDPARCGYQITAAAQARSIATGIEPVSAMTGVLSDDGTTFLSVGDLHVSVVNYAAGTVVRTFSIYDGPVWGSRYSVTEAAMSSDNATVALLRDSSVYVYRLSTGTLVRRIVFTTWNRGIAVNGDGSRVFIGTENGTVQCWSVADSVPVWTRTLSPGGVTLWRHPDDAQLLAGNGSSFHILNASNGTDIAMYPGGAFKRTPRVQGDDIIATTEDGAMRAVKSGTVLASFGSPELFAYAAVDITADRLFTTMAVHDYHSRLYSLVTGTSIFHADWLWGWHKYTRFMQNDRQVLVYNQEGEIRVWNLVYGWKMF